MKVELDTDWAGTLSDLLAMSRLSQAQWARAAGFSEQQISNWLCGRKVPEQASLLRLLAPLGWCMLIAPAEDA